MEIKNKQGKYVHYGAGMICPLEWENYDISPTLRIQKIPFAGRWLAQKAQGFNFPDNLMLGDIVKGLPVPPESCSGVYSSHVLEHLSRQNAIKALHNTYLILEEGGIFRCVLPDLNIIIRKYLKSYELNIESSADTFMREACLGLEDDRDGWRTPIRRFFGNYMHLWMWDRLSFEKVLKAVGFSRIRPCVMGDSQDPMFRLVERQNRFHDALAYECVK